MKVLLLNPLNERISIDDVNIRPTRGSEIAWVYFADEMQKLEAVDQVDVIFANESIPSHVHYDLAIIYRTVDNFAEVNADTKILWVQNPCNKQLAQSCLKLIRQGELDKIIVSTQYHRATFMAFDCFQGRDEMFLLMDNGVQPEVLNFSLEKVAKEKRFLYVSAPHRGLDQFLEIWPRIHQKLPDYSLHIAGHLNLYSEKFKEKKKKLFLAYVDAIEKLRTMPSVYFYDKLDRTQYLTLMASSDALLYPCQSNEETSCIAVHEAMVLQCIPIVSSAGALPEVVTDQVSGLVVEGQPKSYLFKPEDEESKAFRERFIETVVETVQADRLKELRPTENPHIFSWQQQVGRIDQNFENFSLLAKQKRTAFRKIMRMLSTIIR